jgi:DNA-binding IscR family transcriptional regulator
MDPNERIAEIADLPLKHLERRFAELSAAMTAAGDQAETFVNDAVTEDEKYAQLIIMVHSRGIATALEIAATEVGTARSVLEQALGELREEN